MPMIEVSARLTKAQFAALADVRGKVNNGITTVAGMTYDKGTLRYVTFAGKLELPVAKGSMTLAERKEYGDPLYVGVHRFETLAEADVESPAYYESIPTEPDQE